MNVVCETCKLYGCNGRFLDHHDGGCRLCNCKVTSRLLMGMMGGHTLSTDLPYHEKQPTQVEAKGDAKERQSIAESFKKIDLDFDRNIVQINATVIAGLFVLLTLTSLTDKPELPFNRSLATYLTLSLIAPFSASTIGAIQGNREKAITLMKAGFYLIVIMLAIVFSYQGFLDIQSRLVH